MLTRVAFAFCANFISMAPVISESLAPRIAANTGGINPPAKEDFGLESISEELPIVEPDHPVFRSQVRYLAPMPALPKMPENPKLNHKPAPKFPIPRAMGPELPKRRGNPQVNQKPAAKLPIPQAMGPELPQKPGIPQAKMEPLKFPMPRVMGPELPKVLATRIEPDDIKNVNESARLVQESKKHSSEEKNVKPALRYQPKTDMEVKQKTIDLMQQCLYHTQDGNMLNVEEMATRYQTTKQYRMAFIVLKMEEVKNEMHSVYSYLHTKLQKNTKIKIVNQIYYYTHLLKKNIDITYAVEYLIEHFSEM